MTSRLSTNIRVKDVELILLPVQTRVPLKFGSETLSSVTCARAKVTVEDRNGRVGIGWGETPLSVQWVWPSKLAYTIRHQALIDFCKVLQTKWIEFGQFGHPIEIGHAFLENVLPKCQDQFNAEQFGTTSHAMPYLAGLVAASVFDQAIHDAFGIVHDVDVYKTYGSEFLKSDLATFLQPAENSGVSFDGKYPADFLVSDPPNKLPVWHLVGVSV